MYLWYSRFDPKQAEEMSNCLQSWRQSVAQDVLGRFVLRRRWRHVGWQETAHCNGRSETTGGLEPASTRALELVEATSTLEPANQVGVPRLISAAPVGQPPLPQGVPTRPMRRDLEPLHGRTQPPNRTALVDTSIVDMAGIEMALAVAPWDG